MHYSNAACALHEMQAHDAAVVCLSCAFMYDSVSCYVTS